MKPLLAFTILAAIILIPSGFVYAQTSADLNQQLISAMQRLIVLLEQQIHTLQIQLTTQQHPQIAPTNTSQLHIAPINITASSSSAWIEWQTNEPAESKMYLTGGGLSSKLFPSEESFSTEHHVAISGLIPSTQYSFNITAIGKDGFDEQSANFTTSLQPPPPPPPPSPTPTLSLNVLQTSASAGQPVTLSWQSANATSCAFSPGVGSSAFSPSGSIVVVPTSTITYVLTCTGTGGSVSRSASIFVTIPPPPSPAPTPRYSGGAFP